MTKLVTFGDSWPAGDELNHSQGEQPFGAHLAKMMSLDFLNYAQSGSCVEAMVLQLEKYINEHNAEDIENSIAIFFLTASSRVLLVENNKFVNIGSNDNYEIATKYYKFIHHNKLSLFKFNCIITTIQTICKKYNIKDYYLKGWEEIETNYIGFDQGKFFPDQATQILKNELLDLKRVKDSDLFLDHHPSEKGHKVIAEYIFKNYRNLTT